jgi:hypothetical protein
MALKQDNRWDGKVHVISATESLEPNFKVSHIKHGSSAATITLPAPSRCEHGDVFLFYIHPTGTNTGAVTFAEEKAGLLSVFPTTKTGEGQVIAFMCLYGMLFIPLTVDCFVRVVTDAGPMTSTNGSVGQLVYNTSDTTLYVCSVAGSPATWVAAT